MSIGIAKEEEEVIEVQNGDLVIKTDGDEEDVSRIKRKIMGVPRGDLEIEKPKQN